MSNYRRTHESGVSSIKLDKTEESVARVERDVNYIMVHSLLFPRCRGGRTEMGVRVAAGLFQHAADSAVGCGKDRNG